MPHRCFDLSIEGKVAHLRMNRPDERNSMIPAFWSELPTIVTELSDAGATRALVISAEGKHFSSGMDLSVFSGSALQRNGEPGRAGLAISMLVKQLQASFTSLENARMPVIVAIQGACIGGAVDMICAADIRYATADAFFQVQETNIGMTADVGTLQRLPKLIPDGIVRELVFTGRRLDAQRAYEIGLVNAVFADHDTMVSAALATAAEIAGKSPLAVTGAKEALLFARDHSVTEGLHQIATWQAGVLHAAEIAESIAAMREQRTPEYDDLPPVPGPLAD